MEDMQNSNYVPGLMLVSLPPSKFFFTGLTVKHSTKKMYKKIIKLKKNKSSN